MDECAHEVVNLTGRLVQQGQSLQVVHRAVVNHAAVALPAPCWDAIADIDTATDVDYVTDWLTTYLASVEKPENWSGLWFGLYETDNAQGTTEAVLEVEGNVGFPHDQEWLFNSLWDFAGYAPTPGLRRLIPIAAQEPYLLQDFVSYAVVLTYTMALTADVIDRVSPSTLLEGRSLMGIATGFHNGDITMIGTVYPTGFVRSGIIWV